MKELSLVQKYMLWCLDDKGTIGVFNKEAEAGILVAAVIELLRSGSVQMTEKKQFRVVTALGSEVNYLKPLYEQIKDAENIGVKKLVEYYMLAITDKNIKALTHAIGNQLTQANSVKQQEKGVFSHKIYYLPEEGDVIDLVNHIKNINDQCRNGEDILFIKLLETSKQLKKHLSKDEIKILKHTTEKLQQTEALAMLQEMQEYMETIFAFIAVIASV